MEFYTGHTRIPMNDNLEHMAMIEDVVDKKIDHHLIQQVNKMSGRAITGANKYFKRLKLDYPQQETSRASRRSVKAMKKLEVHLTLTQPPPEGSWEEPWYRRCAFRQIRKIRAL